MADHASVGRRRSADCAAVDPVITTFVVVITGHHFVADAAIGAAIALAVLAVSARCSREGVTSFGLIVRRCDDGAS